MVALGLGRIPVVLEALSIVILPALTLASISQAISQVPPSLAALVTLFIDLLDLLLLAVIFYLLVVVLSDRL